MNTLTLPGVYRAIVTGNTTSTLRVQIPQLFGTAVTNARPCLPPGFAGTLPAIGTQVWVSFEGGEARFPVWIGVVT